MTFRCLQTLMAYSLDCLEQMLWLGELWSIFCHIRANFRLGSIVYKADSKLVDSKTKTDANKSLIFYERMSLI